MAREACRPVGSHRDAKRRSSGDRIAAPPHRIDAAPVASGKMARRSCGSPRTGMGPDRPARAVVGVAGELSFAVVARPDGQRPEAWRRCTSSSMVSAAALTLASVFWSGDDCLRRVQALCAAFSASSLTSPPGSKRGRGIQAKRQLTACRKRAGADHGGALRHAAAQNERENETRHVVLPNDSDPTPTLAKHPPGPKREMHSRTLGMS